MLILAAITASMIGLRRRLRRPVLIGALAGLAVSIVADDHELVLPQGLLIAKVHRRRKRYEKLERQGFISAQAIGLFVLGLTSVYREGFETVLFLQSLQLSAVTATVLEGAGIGLAMTLAVAAVTFFLQRKTIGAQIAAAAFVIGSYFLAQEMKVKGPRRRRARAQAVDPTPERELVSP